MRKKEKVLEIIKRLKEEYPDSGCSLIYDENWKLLVSVRLAAQCTDERVNVITAELFEKYPTMEALAYASQDEIFEIVKPCGLGKSKAKDIKECMKMLVEVYNGNIPDNMTDLLKLPGVGRKSANLILGDVFGKDAIVTDTHCIRLSNRLGLTEETEPFKVEKSLLKIVPKEEGNMLCHRFVDHGRKVCSARTKPFCDRCVLSDICPKRGV
ncbi:MAG: endonuclease III [Lachnospiraceae bacterium]|nr:endonuclease III [Lachnospiraceae bacterium]